MTLLTKRLKRETDVRADFDRHSRGRPIIIELEPSVGTLPATISFQFKGTRRRYSAPVAWLAQMTIEAEAARIRREKKNKKAKKLF